VRQALEVRPFHGAVLFAAGQEAMLAGNVDRAFDYWRDSFHAGSIHQQRLLNQLAGGLPAALMLERFRPDLAALRRIAAAYRRFDRRDDLRLVLQHYAARSEDVARGAKGELASKSWLDAAGAYKQMENPSEQLRCLRQAVNCSVINYEARRALGTCLLNMKQFDEAEEHLTWCLRRKPGDDRLRTQAEAAVDGRLRRPTATGRDACPETPKKVYLTDAVDDNPGWR